MTLRLDCLHPPSREIARFVEVLAAVANLPYCRAYRLRLAADEITTNIAVHGYRLAGGVLEVDGGIDTDSVWVCIEDEAPPFDPRTHDRHERLRSGPLSLAGGYGLHIALSSVDQFGYEYMGGRNRCKLTVKRCASKDGGPGGQAVSACCH
jgi:serine/threonine-protein kinase RsbW